ncbi:MAG: hypothetical protein D6737_06010 [Chloroflexi bacterium]|nr:MAG: hypothetical protein D6737_06010 [Chloroflexota bacterium]
MTANVDAMVREGINAYRAGKKEEARTLLLKVVELDPRNEQGWLWLSGLLDSEEEQRICLENVLVINPNNEQARQGVKMLDQKLSGELDENTQLPSPSDSLVTPSDNTSGLSTTTSAPLETSSASAWREGDEILSQDLDDWVTNLNLTGENEASPPATLDAPTGTPAFAVSPFADDPDISAFDTVAESAESTKATTDEMSGIPDDDDELLSSIENEGAMTRTSIKSGLLDDDMDDMFEGGEFLDEDPTEYFRYIPENITVAQQGYSVTAIAGLVIVILLNVGAAAFLVMNLAA